VNRRPESSQTDCALFNQRENYPQAFCAPRTSIVAQTDVCVVHLKLASFASGKTKHDFIEIGMSLLDTILGRPLASREARAERLTTAQGMLTFGLDALSSAAYGPEAILTVLLPLGAAGPDL
jgi:hypothetical protein